MLHLIQRQEVTGFHAFALSFPSSHVAFPFYFHFFFKWIFKEVHFGPEQLWADIDQTHWLGGVCGAGGGGTSENKETEESRAA